MMLTPFPALSPEWSAPAPIVNFGTPAPEEPFPSFTDPKKIRELARRGEAWGDSESRQMLEHALETGRSGIT
jgi:hypothetical protein